MQRQCGRNSWDLIIASDVVYAPTREEERGESERARAWREREREEERGSGIKTEPEAEAHWHQEERESVGQCVLCYVYSAAKQ